MASLTFAEAKVVAPPMLLRKHQANTAQIIKDESQKMTHKHKLFPSCENLTTRRTRKLPNMHKFKKAPPPGGA